MTREEAQKLFDERFEDAFDSASENIASYVGCSEQIYMFTAFDGWREVLSEAKHIYSDMFDDETYVSEGGVQNGRRYFVFASSGWVFIADTDELRRQMLRDLSEMEEY